MIEIGINSATLQEILAGQKTVEGRLATERFRNFQPGDQVRLREDIWRNGKIVATKPTASAIVIKRVHEFTSFRAMLEKLGTSKIMPSARSIDEAVAKYRTFYSAADETRFGVLGIEFEVITADLKSA